MSISVITFYQFFNWSDAEVSKIKTELDNLPIQIKDSSMPNEKSEPLELRGLIIMGREGINATLAIQTPGAELLKSQILKILCIDNLWFKTTLAERHPFHDYLLKVRDEIVTLKRPDILPKESRRHLSPTEWNKVMAEDEPVIIDTRNSFEYKVGHFKNAIDPKTEEFSEFTTWIKNNELPKDKKILIYCTGGIRCEKAIYALEEQGYTNTYQLNGGILNYLNEYPKSQFEGECFVFDYRVAVDQKLEPTKTFKLCPHCGQPGKIPITCKQCAVETVACDSCIEAKPEFHTCSKNCAHHFRMGHKTKRMHTDSFRKRLP